MRYRELRVKEPILFIIFNRPEKTQAVFNVIRQVKPQRLYISSDGFRANIKGDEEKVLKTRDIVKNVDWECEVKTLFHERNLGCKLAVISAINWFFKNEEKGIILEDDCLPHVDFFKFCEELLNYYEKDQRIWVITGNNFQDGKIRGESSYYFSQYNHCWGWASWHRVWEKYDKDISFWPDFKKSIQWSMRGLIERKYWEEVFDKVYNNIINTWDYQLTAALFYYNGLSIVPNVNLVSNIGYGLDATHTTNSNDRHANLPIFGMDNIKHPKEVIINSEADFYTFYKHIIPQTLWIKLLTEFNFLRKFKVL